MKREAAVRPELRETLGMVSMPDEDLRAVSAHLLYEFDMVRGLVDKLAPGGWSAANTNVEQNAMLESFTIHARVLTEFFYEGQPGGRPTSESRRNRQRQRNAYAHDFFDDDTWRRARPRPKPETLQLLPFRVGYEIAHLTYNRIDISDEVKNWPYGEIFLDLARTMRAFLEVVPAERVTDHFLDQAFALIPEAVRNVTLDQRYRVESSADLRAGATVAVRPATVASPKGSEAHPPIEG